MSRKPLMAGNWKMNINHLEAIALTQKIAFSLDEKDVEAVEVVLLPPFTDLRSVQTLVDGDRLLVKYGAQDLSEHSNGAYTGEISGSMLSKLGCSYVVVGHSERRQYHHESDDLVNAKIKAALAHNLTPIICVGEALDIRQAGTHVEYVVAQVDAALSGFKDADVKKMVFAYEPIWAIGTGKVASPEDAEEVCAAIRARLKVSFSADVADTVRVLYGGSVKASNVIEIMAQPNVDGALVGGASLNAEEFSKIARYPKFTPLV